MGRNVLVVAGCPRTHHSVETKPESEDRSDFCGSGNAGIAEIADCFEVKSDAQQLMELVEKKRLTHSGRS